MEQFQEDIIYIYTDGSCNNRTKLAGGCGIVLIYQGHEKHISVGQWINSTSARCEIYGILYALREITDKTIPIILYCDNVYCVKAISEKWAERWERENWVANTTDGLRTNHDLWKQVLEEIRKFKSTVQFQWLKGHNGDKYNEICDKLAAEGGKKPIIADESKI